MKDGYEGFYYNMYKTLAYNMHSLNISFSNH